MGSYFLASFVFFFKFLFSRFNLNLLCSPKEYCVQIIYYVINKKNIYFVPIPHAFFFIKSVLNKYSTNLVLKK